LAAKTPNRAGCLPGAKTLCGAKKLAVSFLTKQSKLELLPAILRILVICHPCRIQKKNRENRHA
jgi:hypothetical protein